jgi:hypothetical protein
MEDRESMRACDAKHLLIVSAYARSSGIVKEVDRLCGHGNGMSPGRVGLALILDALSGLRTINGKSK